MTRKMNAAWLAALGASVMMMGVQAYGTIQKPMIPPKSVMAKPAAAPKTPPTP